MREEHDGEALALLDVAFGILLCGEDAGDLSKYTDAMYSVNVGQQVAVCVFVLKEEHANVSLAAALHVLDCGDDIRIPDDDGLVESGEEWAAGDGEGEDLGVVVGNVGFGYSRRLALRARLFLGLGVVWRTVVGRAVVVVGRRR